jgi:general secretion pathway protein D
MSDTPYSRRLQRRKTLVLLWIGAVLFCAPYRLVAQGVTSSLVNELSTALELEPRDTLCSFHIRIDAHTLIRQVLGCYGIEVALDPAVPQRETSFEIDEVRFPEALEALELVTGTFEVPLSAKQVFVLKDSVDNQKRYEHLQMGTIYLSGMSVAEMNDVAGLTRSLLETGHYTLEAQSNSMTIRAPQRELVPFDALLQDLLQGRSVVLLDVEFYEMDKSKARNLGIVLPGSTKLFNVASEVSRILSANADAVKQIIAAGLADAGDYQKIVAILIASGVVNDSAFNSPFIVFGGGLTEMGLNIGNVGVNMVLNSSEVRSLKRMQIRLLDQEEGTLRSGSRYPILISSTSNVGSSSNASTIPQFQYQDLGVTLKVTPRINQATEVSLALDFTVSALTGSSIGDLPIISNRQYKGNVVLQADQSALLVGALAKQSAAALTGLPFAGGKTNRNATNDVMELILMVTAHVVRVAHDQTAGPVLLLPTH